MKALLSILFAYTMIGCGFSYAANPVEVVKRISSSRICAVALDLHITESDNAIVDEATVNLTNDKAWLFFDSIRPNDVIECYDSKVLINGKPMDVKQNCRVVIYKHGAVVMPYSTDIKPLVTYTDVAFKGAKASYSPDIYYCDKPDEAAPLSMVKPMPQDNDIRSFKLRRGYMATFACEPDGLGYSRIFIADTADLEMADLPAELNHKVSFVRVSKWQYPSKKGWAGSYWKEAPKGLQYVGEQCDLTRSTWYYNWGSSAQSTTNPERVDSSYNQEFVSEKWGAGGSWDGVYSIRNVSHLIGYNEPDHTEQSNVSVARAIEEWPRLMKTGLRLGSPATTSNSWIFEFMREAKKRNYRVDYVVVHAYWGGLSGKEWYDKLKEIHETTGRPLWIKEWNNGANWTNESWPNGTDAQQQKQLKDLKKILTVMDTTTFVERYSIYNWVEDKRAIILNGELTPAGEYYANDNPAYSYNPDKEVVPTWSVREAPVLSYAGYNTDGSVNLSLSDVNGEQIDGYVVERDMADGYETIGNITVPCDSFVDNPIWIEAKGNVSYRLMQRPISGMGKKSNVVSLNVIANLADQPAVSNLLINEKWSLAKLTKQIGNPFFLLGPATYRNKMPLSPRLRNPMGDAVEFAFASYDYQQSPTLVNPDTLALLVLHDGVKIEKLANCRGVIDSTGSEWQKVTFPIPFSTVPVVFATQISDNSAPAEAVHIRNVTTANFEISVCKEEALKNETTAEKVAWLAITTGDGKIGDYNVKVGLSPDASVGDNLSGGYTIETDTADNFPFFFAQMQTLSDNVTSTLRIKSRSSKAVTIIKDREKSASFGSVKPETVGWMIVSPSSTTSSLNMVVANNGLDACYDLLGRKKDIPFGFCIMKGKKVYVKK